MPTFKLTGILHSSVIVSDLQKSLHFYCNVLGLAVDPLRPDLGYPGAWLQIGKQQIHLLQVPNPDPVNNRPTHGGRDRHVALAVEQYQALKNTLRQHSVDFSESKSGRQALFVRDPDGNTVEIVG